MIVIWCDYCYFDVEKMVSAKKIIATKLVIPSVSLYFLSYMTFGCFWKYAQKIRVYFLEWHLAFYAKFDTDVLMIFDIEAKIHNEIFHNIVFQREQ